MQRNRLIHSPQLMKAIPPKRTNPQPEINLGERSNSDRHVVGRPEGELSVNIRANPWPAFSFSACSKSRTQTPDSPEKSPPLSATALPSAPELAADNPAPADRNN